MKRASSVVLIFCLVGVFIWFVSPSQSEELFFTACSGPGSFVGVRDAVIQEDGKVFKVTLLRPDGKEEIFDCPADMTILDAAEEAGVEDMPSSCRAGACASCTAQVVEGAVDQGQQAFLNEEQRKQGYCLSCVSYPTSNVKIKSDCEKDISKVVYSFVSLTYIFRVWKFVRCISFL